MEGNWAPFGESYPVKNGCPTLHCNTLEDGEHGEANVIKGGNAVIGSFPFFQADGDVGLTGVGPNRGLERVI